MKALVTGAAGMLGSAICPSLEADGYDVVRTDIDLRDPGMGLLDVRNAEDVTTMIRAKRPGLVLHLAAETDVDLCEREQDHSFTTNTLGTKNVATAAADAGATLVYISTAGVFDGRKDTPYTEDDSPNPLMHYGRTKLAGEEFVLTTHPDSYVVRAGWMIGGAKKDKKFVSKIIRQVADGATKIFAVDDKFGTPTYTVDFARNLNALLARPTPGLYHMVCGGEGSRYDVARHLLGALDREDIELVPVSSAYFAQDYPAPRPRSEMMVNARLEQLGLNLMRDWRLALDAYLQASESIGTVRMGRPAPDLPVVRRSATLEPPGT